MKRLFPWLALVAGLLIIAFVVRHCRTSGAANYQTASITRGPVTQAVTATGTLNPVVNVQVGSQVSGNIAKLFVDFNSQVKAGQVVAQIDPALFQATVTQAEGDLANAQAALELAKVNATRTQELFAKKTSSQADVDQAIANLHQAQANVKIKQGALDKAKADLDHCTITSPIDGVVISRNVDVGQTVAASLQAPVIFAIANAQNRAQVKAIKPVLSPLKLRNIWPTFFPMLKFVRGSFDQDARFVCALSSWRSSKLCMTNCVGNFIDPSNRPGADEQTVRRRF